MLFLRYLGALCPGLLGCGVAGEKRLSYSITWFCSWSPCANCSIRLAQFLSQMPNLRLRIFVSRLYFCDIEDSQEQEGLRMLKKAGVQLTVMTYKGIGIHLWRNIKRQQTCNWSGEPEKYWRLSTPNSDSKKLSFLYYNTLLEVNINNIFSPFLCRLLLLLANVCSSQAEQIQGLGWAAPKLCSPHQKTSPYPSGRRFTKPHILLQPT